MICSNYQRQQRDPNLFFSWTAPSSIFDDELKELSRLIPLNQEAPEFAVVARHYEWIRAHYTKNESNSLVSNSSKGDTRLTSHTLIQIFTIAYKKGIFQPKPLASSSGASVSSSASSSAIPTIHVPVAEKGVVIEAMGTPFYVQFNPTSRDNPLFILRLPLRYDLEKPLLRDKSGEPLCNAFGEPMYDGLGDGGYGITYRVLNVSKGVFEALKVARKDTYMPGENAACLKKEYAILTYIKNHAQGDCEGEDLPIQAAPHQLITFPKNRCPQIMQVAYAVKLYLNFNLDNLFERRDLYNQVSFQQRLMLCKRLLRGFQILSTLNIHYTDIDRSNVLLLRNDKNEHVPYIGDFGGVELISRFRKDLSKRLSEATPQDAFPEIEDIAIGFRMDNMSENDGKQLEGILTEMKKAKQLKTKEEQVVQFESKIFPNLLQIKTRINIFAIGKLLCEIMRGGKGPYPYVPREFPNPKATFSKAKMRIDLKSCISCPKDPLYRLIPAAIIGRMVDQTPSNRHSLDWVVKAWNKLTSTWEMPDSDATKILYQFAKDNRYVQLYPAHEDAILKSKLGSLLTPDQFKRVSSIALSYAIDDYVVARDHSTQHCQIVQIKDERVGYASVWNGREQMDVDFHDIYTINIPLLMAEEEAKRANAPAAAAAASS